MGGAPEEPDGTATGRRRWDDVDWGEEDAPLPDTRSGARRLALEVLYWESTAPGQLEEALRQRATATRLGADNAAFAGRLARAAAAHATELDDLIAATATGWRRERIARLDGLVLRLAAAELLYLDDSPPRVAVNEAIELAKAYCGPQSYAFVNGILDAIARARGIHL